MRATRDGAIAPAAVASALGGITTGVLRRMEDDYATKDTLATSTVAAMYGTYTMYAAILTWASARRVWPVALPPCPTRVIGITLTTVGSGAALAGARPFGAGAQLSGIDPGSLHATGAYRFSRNPQYLGLGLIVTGVAVATRSAFAGLGAAGVWMTYRHWIPSEERHLTRVFGDQYVTYRASVRRWFGTRADVSSRPTSGPGRPSLWGRSPVARC